MDRETIDKLWIKAHFDAKEVSVRYHFAKLVAEHLIKSAPDYKMGYADGVAVEREACAKVAESEPRVWDANALPPQKRIAAAIRARGEATEKGGAA